MIHSNLECSQFELKTVCEVTYCDVSVAPKDLQYNTLYALDVFKTKLCSTDGSNSCLSASICSSLESLNIKCTIKAH